MTVGKNTAKLILINMHYKQLKYKHALGDILSEPRIYINFHLKFKKEFK